jgi:RHS repeat-associated protein
MRYILSIIAITVIQSVSHSQHNSTSDPAMNWIVTKSLNSNGSIKSIGKQYFDNNGQATQAQARSMTNNQVLATQVINDALGRSVLTTMTAPVNSADFGFKTNFVLNGSGTNYTYQNFDDAKTNNPDAIGGQSTAGTLGWYYSNNNTMETRVATSSYPYSRSDFYKDGTGSGKRSAGIGDAYRMGQGREVSSFLTPVINELNNYLTIRNKFFNTGLVGSLPTSLAYQAFQSVTKDINGKEVITITDRDGKTLMTARPGTDLAVSNTVTINALAHQLTMPTVPSGSGCSFTGTQTIKIYGSGNTITLTNPSNNVTTITGPAYGVTVAFGPGDWGTVIRSDEPVTVTYNDKQGGTCMDVQVSSVSQQTAAFALKTYYFKILADNTTVTITGSYTLYDMATETSTTLIAGNKLNKGYYKLVANSGPVDLTYSNSYGDISYHYYNQLGQLVSVVSPEGSKRLIQNLAAYANRFTAPFMSVINYDIQGRLIDNTVADGAKTEFIYRKDGKLRFSQNAQQATTGWFSYINYDQWGRPFESGEYRPSGDVTFAGLKTNTTIQEDVSATGGLTIAGNKYEWIKTKYDAEDNTHGQAGYTQQFTRGAISMTEGPDSKTWYSYDEQRRVVWVIKWINGLGYKTTDYTFDAEGRTTKVVYQKNTAAELFAHYYEYDADGRLMQVSTNTVDNFTTKTLQAKYIYYLHGPVKRVEIAGTLQGIDYTYALDGKLKAINHADKTKDPGQDGVSGSPNASFLEDAFGELLDYYPNDYVRSGTNIGSTTINTSDAPEQYGGQVRGMSWFSKKPAASGGSESPTTYVFKYDAKYQYNDATWGTVSANSFTPQAGVNKETVSGYDLHGNILNLSRTNGSATTIDNFLYTYQTSPEPTNRLTSITQQTTSQNYATYQYDNVGRIKAEVPGAAYTPGAPAKYIKYDVSGKVIEVYRNSGMTTLLVKYVYDELGKRIKKLSYNTSGVLTTTTFYVYDAGGKLMSIYEQPNGGAIAQKEIPFGGRTGVYYKATDTYRYEMSDHLGNVRAVFLKQSSSSITMMVYRDYYPFGMEIPGRSYTDATGYRYGYQGQYAEKDPETNWNAFELRMYDSRIGRWLSIDPKNEFYSPYVGMGNDPISKTDPDGGETDDIIIRGKDKHEIRIIAPGDNVYIDVPFDIGEDRTFDFPDLDIVDLSRLAIGYSVNASVNFGLYYTGNYSGELTYVKYLNQDYGNYWYVYGGGRVSTGPATNINLGASVGASLFVAYNTSNSPDWNDPLNFSGDTDFYNAAIDGKRVVGGGISLEYFWMTSGWKGVSLGISAGLGWGFRAGVFRGYAYSVLFNNVMKTRDRPLWDRLSNEFLTTTSSILQYIRRN